MVSIADRPQQDGWVLGLLCSGHFLSHFYLLAFPPMYLFFQAEFNVSYSALGLSFLAYNLLGGFAQSPVGFLVDRFGPRQMLMAGLLLNSVAITLIGFASSYEMILVLAVFAGLGNSVFHPADYAIMSGSISESRIGRAYSMHTFSGFFGGACAPPVMLALTGFTDWRTAFIAIGLVGIAVWAVMLVRGSVLVGESRTPPSGDTATRDSRTGVRFLLSAPVLLFLAFFICYGMATGGLSSFTVSGLINLHGIRPGAANLALTGHLFGIAGGVALAGVVVDRYTRHTVTATIALVIAIAFVILPGFIDMSGVLLVTVMTIVGLGMGAVLPPRDLMVRAMIPAGQTGKVFGFVFIGYAVGSSFTPPVFGWFLDNGMPELVFVLSALFIAVALIAVTLAQKLATRMVHRMAG